MRTVVAATPTERACRGGNLPPVVIAAAGVFSGLPQTLCVPLALPLGELSAATPTERACRDIFLHKHC
ncbi:MAG: hypothetical protein FWH14_02195 [Oscillospiraceae bacterium]|nr:hypothetical protein [Oscillospiraceae bacterium]